MAVSSGLSRFGTGLCLMAARNARAGAKRKGRGDCGGGPHRSGQDRVAAWGERRAYHDDADDWSMDWRAWWVRRRWMQLYDH
jgi:hypothetical protein